MLTFSPSSEDQVLGFGAGIIFSSSTGSSCCFERDLVAIALVARRNRRSHRGYVEIYSLYLYSSRSRLRSRRRRLGDSQRHTLQRHTVILTSLESRRRRRRRDVIGGPMGPHGALRLSSSPPPSPPPPREADITVCLCTICHQDSSKVVHSFSYELWSTS